MIADGLGPPNTFGSGAPNGHWGWGHLGKPWFGNGWKVSWLKHWRNTWSYMAKRQRQNKSKLLRHSIPFRWPIQTAIFSQFTPSCCCAHHFLWSLIFWTSPWLHLQESQRLRIENAVWGPDWSGADYQRVKQALGLACFAKLIQWYRVVEPYFNWFPFFAYCLREYRLGIPSFAGYCCSNLWLMLLGGSPPKPDEAILTVPYFEFRVAIPDFGTTSL